MTWKSYLFEKEINRIHKPLGKLTKTKREKTQISNIRNKVEHYCRSWSYYKDNKRISQITLCSWIWQLRIKGPIPQKPQITTHIKDEIDNLSSLKTIKEIEFVIKSFQKTNA